MIYSSNGIKKFAAACLLWLFVVAPATALLPGDVAPVGRPDGKVTLADALITLRMATGLLPGDPLADVAPAGSPDGAVTAGDALLILRSALGMLSLNPPLADAGPNRVGKVAADVARPNTEEIVFLDGSASRGIEYSWSLAGYRDGSAPLSSAPASFPAYGLTSPGTASTGFFAGSAGTYTLQLDVIDGAGTTASSSVEVRLLADDDGDGLVNADDLDQDGDGFLNDRDAFPDKKQSHGDFDGDGVGNWFTNDVDGDGVADFEDDFPLDATKTRYPIYNESKEPGESNQNDGITVAEDAGALPIRIEGSITADGNRTDIDYFALEWTAGRFSIVLDGASEQMQPIIAVIDSSGTKATSTRANLPVDPGSTAVSVLIPSDGTYYLSITDARGNSDPAWSYTVDIFDDDDLDGIPTDLEIAIDSNHLSADSDADGVPDFVEVRWALLDWWQNRDSDGDGLPTWWDRDSDADRIPDSIEFQSAEERPDLDETTLAALNDMDADQILNLFDDDSDGDGVGDRQEAGPNPWQPVDTDHDALADFLDRDNDDDGLLDQNEQGAYRLTPLEIASMDELRIDSLDNAGLDIAGLCRADDKMEITGVGLPQLATDGWIVLRGGTTVYNTRPNVTAAGLEFDCPMDIGPGLFEVFVTNGQLRSPGWPLLVPADGAPILVGAEVDAVGRQVVFSGLGLDTSLSVHFTGADTTADNSGGDAERLVVAIPSAARPGPVFLHTAAGDSNRLWIDLTRKVSGTIELPPGAGVAVTDLDISRSPLTEAHPAVDGSFTTEAGLNVPTVMTALVEQPGSTEQRPSYAPYLQAVLLPGESSARLSAESTALALVWQGLGVDTLLDDGLLATARDGLAALPEVAALAGVLRVELAADPTRLAGFPLHPAIEAAAKDALIAGAGLLAGLQSAQATGFTIRPAGKFGPDAEVTPREADDIAVYEYSDSGNIAVENDSQLYLSVKITTAGGRVVQPHITGYAGMAGPQGYGLLFWATTTQYKAPNGQNATVEVITPGIDTQWDPRGAPSNYSVWKWLLIRTYIERAIWPLLAEILPLDSSDFLGVLFTHAPTLLDITANQALQGDISGAMKSLVWGIWQDFASLPPGPITQALAKRYGKQLAQRVLARIAAKIGAKFVPGIGQIALAVEVAGHINNGANAIKAITDIGTTDAMINFDVRFPLQIDQVIPSKVRPDGRNRTFKIVGSGFGPIQRGIWPFVLTLKPRIKFVDAGGLERTPQPFFISEDGTEMWVTVEGWWLNEDTEGPLKVEVHHPTDLPDTIVEKDPAVEIVDKVEIASIAPESGGAGSAAVIHGSGFSNSINDNEVTVGGVAALITSASDTRLGIVIPSQLNADTYPVVARSRFDRTWSDWSNAVEFEVLEGDVKITVCDNGGLKDDAFALYVDGGYEGTLYATPGGYCHTYSPSLSVGTHTAMLLGIEAPDSIGTYSIAFEGVQNLAGDSRSGSDLVPGVRKFFTFDVEVGATAGAASPPVQPGAAYQPLAPDPEAAETAD